MLPFQPSRPAVGLIAALLLLAAVWEGEPPKARAQSHHDFPSFRYVFDAMWGSKGQGLNQVNGPQGICVSPDGRVFIADTGNDRILVWGENGNPVTSYGSFGTRADWQDPPQFDHPMAVLVDGQGRIFVADTLNDRVVQLDSNGMVVQSWGSLGQGKGEFNQPRALAEDHFGGLWVLDMNNSRVEVFGPDGGFRYSWGTFGTTPNPSDAEMNLPRGMALNSIDQAVVADSGNFRMEVFDNRAVPVTIQGWYGEKGPYEFKDMGSVAVTPVGVAAIADGTSGRVMFYNSRDGLYEYLGRWRAKDEIVSPAFQPKFRGIASDPENRIYVTDIHDNVILRLKPLQPFTPVAPAATPTSKPESPYSGQDFPLQR